MFQHRLEGIFRTSDPSPDYKHWYDAMNLTTSVIKSHCTSFIALCPDGSLTGPMALQCQLPAVHPTHYPIPPSWAQWNVWLSSTPCPGYGEPCDSASEPLST